MKELIRLVARIAASPFVLGLLVVHSVFSSILFTIYGGEWISYKKDDLITMKMIYKELKKDKQLNN